MKTKKNINPGYANKTSIKYYLENRNSFKDIYKSEKKFFKKAIIKSNTFLDVGCAVGNFVNVIKSIKKKFEYTGLDIKPKLIKIAKKQFPKHNFKIIKNSNFQKKNKYDLVFSFGTLHHVKNYKSYIKQMILSAKKYVLFDVRLTNEKTINSEKQYQKIFFSGKYDQKSRIRYITINQKEFSLFLKKLTKNYVYKSYAYKHKVSKNFVGKYNKVLMKSVFIDKT
tara:strand:+ start:144 stop:815 length:672 start_codon:yes stop_codon:yes gene_type:complete